MYERSLIPKRFWGKTLDDYKVGRGYGSEDGRAAVDDYIQNMKEHREHGVGVTLLGPPGTGKTLLLSIIGMSAADQKYDVLYMPLAKYVRLELNLMRWERYQDEEVEGDWVKLRQKLLDIRNKVEFLLLDDVGKEHVTDTRYAEDEFDFLLRNRYDCGLPTLMTSNLKLHRWGAPEDGLKGRYTEAMESFIHEAAPVVEIDEADYRSGHR